MQEIYGVPRPQGSFLDDLQQLHVPSLTWSMPPEVAGRPSRALRRIAGHTLAGLLAFGGCIPTIMGIMPVEKLDLLLLGGLTCREIAALSHAQSACWFARHSYCVAAVSVKNTSTVLCSTWPYAARSQVWSSALRLERALNASVMSPCDTSIRC